MLERIDKEFKVRINKKERSVKIFYDKKDRESSLNSLRLLTRHPPLYELLFRSMKAVPTLPTITKENIEFLAHRDKRRRFRGKASGAKPATSGNQDFAELIAAEKRNLSLFLSFSSDDVACKFFRDDRATVSRLSDPRQGR